MCRYRDTKSKIFFPRKKMVIINLKLESSILFENTASATRPKKDISTVLDKN